MLREGFVREGNMHYLAVPSKTWIDPDLHKNKVFEVANVPCFMQYEFREIDGEQSIYYILKYRITLKQALGDIPLTFIKLRNMVNCIIGAIERARLYIAPVDGIVWDTERTFIEVATGKIVFSYCAASKDTNGSLREFLMEIIQYVDRDDEEAYLFMMEFYDLMTTPDWTLITITDFMKKYLLPAELYNETRAQKDPIKDAILEMKDEIKVEDKPIVKQFKMAIIGVGLLDLLMAMTVKHEYLFYCLSPFLVLGIISFVALVIGYFLLAKEDMSDAIMQAYFERDLEEKEQPPRYTAIEKIWVERQKKKEEERKEREKQREWYKEAKRQYQENQRRIKNGETDILQTRKPVKEKVVEEKYDKVLCLKSMNKEQEPLFTMESNNIVFGTLEEYCNYVLTEKGISRVHAKIIKKNDGYYLLDLNSTNGTFLNGERIECGLEYKIEEGDLIAFAQVVEMLVVISPCHSI